MGYNYTSQGFTRNLNLQVGQLWADCLTEAWQLDLSLLLVLMGFRDHTQGEGAPTCLLKPKDVGDFA